MCLKKYFKNSQLDLPIIVENCCHLKVSKHKNKQTDEIYNMRWYMIS